MGNGISLLDNRATIHVGDVLDRLAAMEPDSVDCVVTSPPYWGLRDYGVDGQIGLERTLGEHLDVMIAVFEGVRRVLKPTGTLWLNYGDCYATQPNGRSASDTKAAGTDDRTFRDKPFSTVGPIYDPTGCGGARGDNKGNSAAPGGRIVSGGRLKPKDLCMIPNRLAIALQEAGWWVRSEIIWAKPNAMPDSSGLYRPATAHEKIFLLTKSVDAGGWWVARDTKEISDSPDLGETCLGANGKERNRWTMLGHFYDAGAVRVETDIVASTSKQPDGWNTGPGAHGSFHPNGREKGAKPGAVVAGDGAKGQKAKPDKQRGHSRRHNGFNDRWDHMSKAEQQANGRMLRNYEPVPPAVWVMPTAAFTDAHFATFPPELVERCLDAGCPPKGRVLDPFGGAGTTALVALAKGHTCDLIELNPAYADMAADRISEAWMGDAERTAARMKRKGESEALPLFGATSDQAVGRHDQSGSPAKEATS